MVGLITSIILSSFSISDGICGPANGMEQEFFWQLPPADFASVNVGIPYRNYYYNYPHSLPGDYVYRTARVFPPPTKRKGNWHIFSWFRGEPRQPKANPGQQANQGLELREKVRDLASQLVLNGGDSFEEYAVTVSTFVNLDNLYQTSSLGRYLSEQLITDLQLSGVEVVEVRKTPAILIKQQAGEYGMSRDMDELSFVHSSQAMVVGTYTFVDDQIFLNARLLRNKDKVVLSSASMVFGLDQISGGLLAHENTLFQRQVKAGPPVQVRSYIE
ncbi:MAG: hypothetical protein KKB30_09730 [Proteobacteria bacterium]|nr:hypothetical protein [Pseudomonadota bacterium]MBU1717000.1 hypothetical protein [Pseudomonadota bacterium]